jgi:hypothetical protein
MANRPGTPTPAGPRGAGAPRAEPPYKKMLIGFFAWLVWWLIVGRRSVTGWVGIAAFLGIAESWPLFLAFYEVRAGRRRWAKPPGFWIAFYGIGSAWLALLLTAIAILPWSGEAAGMTNAIVKIGGAITFAGAAWLAWRLGGGR